MIYKLPESLKSEQKEIIHRFWPENNNMIAVLPTGYGKSLLYTLLSKLGYSCNECRWRTLNRKEQLRAGGITRFPCDSTAFLLIKLELS